MTQWLRGLNGRTMTGLALGFWIILIACGSIRAQADGPAWGLHLTHSPDGRVVVDSIEAVATAWNGGVRPGDEIVTIDGLDARLFDRDDLPGSVRAIAFRDSAGLERTVQAADISPSQVYVLFAGALLFALLGALVYRWSAEPIQGRLFLLLSGAFATALAATPAGRLGHAWTGYILPAAALLASPSLFGLFLAFPRPLVHARTVA